MDVGEQPHVGALLPAAHADQAQPQQRLAGRPPLFGARAVVDFPVAEAVEAHRPRGIQRRRRRQADQEEDLVLDQGPGHVVADVARIGDHQGGGRQQLQQVAALAGGA